MNLEVEILGQRLFPSDFGGPLAGPSGFVRVAAVEGMVDHDLAPREELDVRPAHAEVLHFLVREQIFFGHHVERLAHTPAIGRDDGGP